MFVVQSGTACFSGDQQFDVSITYYDTPFFVLEGSGTRAASPGLAFSVREPVVGDPWTLATDLEAAASPAAARTVFDDPALTQVIENGRTGNAVGYWAGGAPGEHGVSQVGRVGYMFRGYVRPGANRAWFASGDSVPVTIAYGGNGYFRADVDSGTTIINDVFTEKDYLTEGLALSTPITVTSGSLFELYYVQRPEDAWGGFVFKLVFGDLSGLSDDERAEVVRDAPIFGCGFADAGTAVTPRTVAAWSNLNIVAEGTTPTTARFELPLVNPQVNDLVGWEFVRDPFEPEDVGRLKWLNAGSAGGAYEVSRDRQIRVQASIGNESWPLFTGYITDFTLTDGTAQIEAASAARALLTQYDRNRPDRVDYMTYNYRRRRSSTEPVYDIPAFDNWPVEHAVRVLLSRGGLDASLLDQPAQLPFSGVSPVLGGRVLKKFEARSMDGRPIRLSRAVHYGNYGQAFTEALLPDDPYLFPPVNTKEIYGRALEICDRYGLRLRMDAYGHVRLERPFNPTVVEDFDATDGTNSTNGAAPEAHGGTYVQTTTGGVLTKTIRAARVDVAVGRFAGAGTWGYSVARASAPGTPIASGSVATSASREEFFYDYEAAADGVNATVFTAWSGSLDTYIVTLTATGTCRVDCLLGYSVDPERSLVPSTLTTTQNALSIKPQGTGDQMRNHVIVVGRRKATVTDSTKLRSTQENPEAEFVVARAVDVRSVADPTALHYVGRVKESIIYSDQVADDDFANYLARTFIFRYRNPQVGADVDEHTLLPFLELGDPVLVREGLYETVSDAKVQWTSRLTHTINNNQWLSSIQTTPFPPYPSFEPRADIDIDRVFSGAPAIDVELSYTSVSGHARLNVSGQAPLVAVDNTWPSGDLVFDTLAIAGNALDYGAAGLPHPVPSTIQVRPAGVSPTAGTAQTYSSSIGLMKLGTELVVPNLAMDNLQAITSVQASINVLRGGIEVPAGTITLTENPADNNFRLAYHVVGANQRGARQMVLRRTFLSPVVNRLPDGTVVPVPELIRVSLIVNWRQGAKDSSSGWVANTPYHQYTEADYTNEEIDLPWKQGDTASAEYNRNTAITQMDVRYRTFPGYANYLSGGDFYVSGASPFYDPYTSEIGHLVKVKFDLLISGFVRVSVRSVHNPDVVAAWLTEPTNESPDPEQHWQYMSAGSNKSLFWDGVDNVGTWNFTQSEDYANAAAGVFEQEQKPRVGKGFYVWNRERDGGNLGPLALIDDPFILMSGDLTKHERAEHAIGTYASWFVLVEAKNDELETVARQGGPQIPRRMDSRYLLDSFQSNVTGSTSEAVVHTHLSAPSRLTMDIEDWTGSTFDETDWYGSNGPNGAFWSSTPDSDASINNLQPVRVTFTPVLRHGVLWAGLENEQSVKLFRHAHLKALIYDQFVSFAGVSYPTSAVEAKQIVSRRLHNDSHTVRFDDTDYHRVKDFLPSPTGLDLRWIFLPKHFRKDFTGASQLEELEFGNYLQLEEVPNYDPTRSVGSARSRLQIAFMSYLFYLSAYTQDRSGRMCWVIDPSFTDQSKILGNTEPTTWPEDWQRQHRRTVYTRQWLDEKPDKVNLWTAQQIEMWQLTGTIGEKLVKHKWSEHDPTSSTIGGTSWASYGLSTDQYTDYHRTNGNLNLLSLTAGQMNRQLPSLLGLWNFETDPTWNPCIFRDFWPYHLIPPMVDTAYAMRDPTVREARQNNIYASVDDSSYLYQDNTGNDPARGDVWSSGIHDQTEANASKKKFDPGTKIEPKAPPVKTNGDVVAANMADYTRQDDTVHWEELRGMFSRGPRPAEQPKKSTPALPYYIQEQKWKYLWTQPAFSGRGSQRKPSAYTNWTMQPANHFWIGFRQTYNWESGTLFPVDIYGVEQLQYANLERARLEAATAAKGALKYDGGGWVGWKDDGGSSALEWNMTSGGAPVTSSVFDSGRMPIAHGPVLPETKEVYMHMVLVNERRESPVTPASYTVSSPITTQIIRTPSSITDSVGAAVTVQLQPANAAGDPTKAQRLKITSADPTIAQVFERWPTSQDIVVRLLRTGSTTITVQLADVTETIAVTAT